MRVGLQGTAMLTLALVCSAVANDGEPAENLFGAIERNDLAALEMMLEKGADANAPGERGTTPLLFASAFGSVEAVKLLLGRGADVNASNVFHATALMWSVTEPQKVELLLSHGADVNAKGQRGRTALLMAAAHNGSDRVVERLLAKGADPKATDEVGLTMLSAASAVGNARQVALALEKGLDVNARDANGFTALMNAAGNGDVETVRLLLGKGAKVNVASIHDPAAIKAGAIARGNYTALMLASMYGPPEIVNMLLRAGADVRAEDVRERDALNFAVTTEYADPAIVRLLLEAGADPNGRDRTGQSSADWATKYGSPAILSLLKARRPPQLDAPSSGGNGTTRQAAERSIRLLEGVMPTFINKGGCIACHAQNINAVVASYARGRGFLVDEQALEQQLKTQRASYALSGDRLLQRFDGGASVDTMDYAMLHLSAAGYKPDRATNAVVYNLLSQQMTDGSWRRGNAVPRVGPSPAARAPIQDSDIVRTALSLRAIQFFEWEGRKADLRWHVQAAQTWLERVQPRFNEEYVMQMLGLGWAGEDRENTIRLGQALLRQQRADGGWAQNPYLESDAYATGQTLLALYEAGGVSASDAAFARGVKFLLRTQHADGSWHVRSRSPKFMPEFESGFPYGGDQWISMMGTGWATVALTIAAEPRMARTGTR